MSEKKYSLGQLRGAFIAGKHSANKENPAELDTVEEAPIYPVRPMSPFDDACRAFFKDDLPPKKIDPKLLSNPSIQQVWLLIEKHGPDACSLHGPCADRFRAFLGNAYHSLGFSGMYDVFDLLSEKMFETFKGTNDVYEYFLECRFAEVVPGWPL